MTLLGLNKTPIDGEQRCACGCAVITVPASMCIEKWDGTEKREISIDSCIAHVVAHLWESGIKTLGCCCGHKKQNPSIILGDGSTADEARDAELAIAQVDEREFDLLSWRLTKVNACEKL
jgi:hypothetical protein